MKNDNTIIRSLHDVGLAGWFGSVLMAAVATNRAVGDAGEPTAVGRVTNSVWSRWRTANAALVIAHLVGGAGLLFANKERVGAQKGVGASTVTKAVVTAAAVGASAYSGVLGKKLSDAGDIALEDAVTPVAETPDDIEPAVKQLAILQWAIPALTGVLIVLTALHGEQQRPSRIVSGALDRLNPAS